MSKSDIAKLFAESFRQATDGMTASVFSGSVRFIAMMLVIIGMMWCINHFMSVEEKGHDSFLIRLGSRLVRLTVGLCLFILMLMVKGN